MAGSTLIGESEASGVALCLLPDLKDSGQVLAGSGQFRSGSGQVRDMIWAGTRKYLGSIWAGWRHVLSRF